LELLMAKMKDHCDMFLTALGARLVTLGFPEKIIRKTLFFQQSTEAGYVGIHVNPIYRPNSIDFSLRCAVSITSVQELLVHTELYNWDGGLTWTCGAFLKQMRHKLSLMLKSMEPMMALFFPRTLTSKFPCEQISHLAT
jgi:hypothetical protein